MSIEKYHLGNFLEELKKLYENTIDPHESEYAFCDLLDKPLFIESSQDTFQSYWNLVSKSINSNSSDKLELKKFRNKIPAETNVNVRGFEIFKFGINRKHPNGQYTLESGTEIIPENHVYIQLLNQAKYVDYAIEEDEQYVDTYWKADIAPSGEIFCIDNEGLIFDPGAPGNSSKEGTPIGVCTLKGIFPTFLLEKKVAPNTKFPIKPEYWLVERVLSEIIFDKLRLTCSYKTGTPQASLFRKAINNLKSYGSKLGNNPEYSKKILSGCILIPLNINMKLSENYYKGKKGKVILNNLGTNFGKEKYKGSATGGSHFFNWKDREHCKKSFGDVFAPGVTFHRKDYERMETKYGLIFGGNSDATRQKGTYVIFNPEYIAELNEIYPDFNDLRGTMYEGILLGKFPHSNTNINAFYSLYANHSPDKSSQENMAVNKKLLNRIVSLVTGDKLQIYNAPKKENIIIREFNEETQTWGEPYEKVMDRQIAYIANHKEDIGKHDKNNIHVNAITAYTVEEQNYADLSYEQFKQMTNEEKEIFFTDLNFIDGHSLISEDIASTEIISRKNVELDLAPENYSPLLQQIVNKIDNGEAETIVSESDFIKRSDLIMGYKSFCHECSSPLKPASITYDPIEEENVITENALGHIDLNTQHFICPCCGLQQKNNKVSREYLLPNYHMTEMKILDYNKTEFQEGIILQVEMITQIRHSRIVSLLWQKNLGLPTKQKR